MISPAGNATALDLYLSSSPAHDLHAPEGFKRRVEFESTLGDCSTETFIADMRRTREAFGKQSLKVETYHVIISQTHEEADPLDTQAGLRQHEMVRAFVAEAFPGHQAKLTTQRDNGRFEDTEDGSVWVPGKWHTHVQVASVSEREATLARIGIDGAETRLHYAAGRAIDGHMKDIYHLRRTNNRVILRELGYDNAAYVEACRRHSAAARDGRPVSHLGENVTRKDFAGRADPDGPGYSAHDAVRAKLREARALANDWDDYTDRLQASGVQTRVTGTSGVSYSWIGADGAEMKSRARGKTGLGSDYTKASVEKQCQINAAERAKGIEPEAPELIMAPPSPLTTDRPVPIYLTEDGRPPWDLEFEAYTEKVRQSGETYEERARQALRKTIADPWVTDRDRLIAASLDYGITVEGRTGEPTVSIAALDGRGQFTMDTERLGGAWTGRALDEQIRIERNRTTDDRNSRPERETGVAAEQRPAEPGRISSAAIEDRRARNVRRAADQRAEEHHGKRGRPGGDSAATGQQQPARDAGRRSQDVDKQSRDTDRRNQDTGKPSTPPRRPRPLGNPARPDRGRDYGR
ncbi:hypothetical protein [Rhodococcus qingshengii]|uniref:hypothetical protein n=1 Tax=Rhodococcus qingshengii TaxID=334542 RepID=UPI001E52DCB9|nr:hypothetical protein [Rhodococcus qingshengii]UDF21574.1 hypothetical protein LE551_01430 [Rhodococcus qingshengii]